MGMMKKEGEHGGGCGLDNLGGPLKLGSGAFISSSICSVQQHLVHMAASGKVQNGEHQVKDTRRPSPILPGYRSSVPPEKCCMEELPPGAGSRLRK